jgi:Tfp pilus assembly protein PilE
VEVMIVLVIIGIMLSMAAPSYQRAVEQSRADVAAANLRALWAAQRLYWLDNHAYTADLTALRSLGLLDSEIALSATGYGYAVTSAGSNNFQAAATHVGGTCWTGAYTIDETGQITGAIHAAGQADITPGFQ